MGTNKEHRRFWSIVLLAREAMTGTYADGFTGVFHGKLKRRKRMDERHRGTIPDPCGRNGLSQSWKACFICKSSQGTQPISNGKY
nr:hypothetical protein [Tanacetum cinerariifolium]